MASAKLATRAAPTDRDDLPSVRGEIVFGRRSPDETAPSVVVPNYEGYPMVTYDIPIRNARPIVDELSLDKEGFVLAHHTTTYGHLRDPEVMCDKYLDELALFIKGYFNASSVIPRRRGFRVRRSAGSAIPKNGWNASNGVREPGGMAHIEYAPIFGPVSAAEELQERGIPIRPYRKMMIIQAWRALSPPPQDIPMALCDASTVVNSDVAMADYVGNKNEPGHVTQLCSVLFSPAQRWYYFPEMTPDEVILFKAYDTSKHYTPQTPHSAFDDRRTYPNANVRESVDARFFVYFD